MTTNDGRLTINLTPKAKLALEQIMRSTESNKTDAIIRAVKFYAKILKLEEGGTRAIYIGDGETFERQRFE